MAGDFMKSITIVLLHADKYKKKCMKCTLKKAYPPFTPTNFKFFFAPPLPCLSGQSFFFMMDLRPNMGEMVRYVKTKTSSIPVHHLQQ